MSKFSAPVEAPPPEHTRAALEPHDYLPRLEDEDRRRGKSYWWVWLLIFGSIAYGCYRLYVFEEGKKQEATNAKAAMKPRVIPVVAQPARTGNLPVYLEGLGTVT